MRRDILYLNDIVEAVQSIEEFLEGIREERFLSDKLRQSAVLQKLAVIGEASARISPELKAIAPHVPWAQIAGFRNVAVHAYFNVDWAIVWMAATHDAPTLKLQVQAILLELPGN